MAAAEGRNRGGRSCHPCRHSCRHRRYLVPQLTGFTRSAEVIGAELERSLVLLHTRTWTYLELNETGIEIWQHLEQPQSIDSLVARLLDQFEVDERRCYTDTETFVEDLMVKQF